MTGRPTQVHLGAGAFARGHTWLCTARAEADGAGEGWGVVAVAQRSDRVIGALRRNDWAYTVVEQDQHGVTPSRVEVVRAGVVAQHDPAGLRAALADPDTHVVTVTATETAYPRTERGTLHLAAVADDVRDGGVRTLVGQVVATARERERAGVGPISFVVCDNILNGGEVLRALALEFADVRGEDAVVRWLEEHGRFPNAVVDRIVPAPTDEIRREAASRTGARDEGLVATEPFFRWIVQDDFAARRPRWERGGARFVPDVGPWQAVKLNLVNAPHSFLAYLGLLTGHTTTYGAVEDPILRRGVEATYTDDLIPAVPAHDDIAPAAEAESALRRFGNPFIAHRLDQIAAGGSTKLSQRLISPVRAAKEKGRDAPWLALILAAWGECAARGIIDEPALDQLATDTDRARAVVEAAGLSAVADHGFTASVEARWDGISRYGAHEAVERLLDRRR